MTVLNLIQRRKMKIKLLMVFALITQLWGCATHTSTAVPYIYEPTANGSFPGIIILHTSAGLYSHETEYAQMLTKRDYVTAVADYFAEGGPENIAKAYDELRKNPRVAGQRIGVVGFSRGAFTGINQIAAWDDRRPVSAIVSYYIGPSLDIPNQNLPPILFVHGDEDNNVDYKKILQFCDLQKMRGHICQVEIYEHGRHAFDHPQARLGGYSENISNMANKRAFEFLDTYLKDDH